MMTMEKHIVDCETGDIQTVELTQEEIDAHTAAATEAQTEEQAAAATLAARESALAAIVSMSTSTDPNVAALASAVHALHGTPDEA